MSLGGKYVFATVMCFVLPMRVLTSCSFVLCGLMALGMFMFVNGASPVGFALSLFHLCAFQMNPVCVWQTCY